MKLALSSNFLQDDVKNALLFKGFMFINDLNLYTMLRSISYEIVTDVFLCFFGLQSHSYS